MRTGESIRDVDVPVAGPVFEDAGDAVIEAGRDAQAQAREAETDIRTASILLGLAVWLVPSLPLLFSYGPARTSRGRERRALRALVRAHPDDPDLDRMLATRALAHLPYRRLRRWARHGPTATTAPSPTRSSRAKASRAPSPSTPRAARAPRARLEQRRGDGVDRRQRERLARDA